MDILKAEALEAVEKFQVSRNKMLKLVTKHSALFEAFETLTNDYNDRLKDAKDAIKEIESVGGFPMGPFNRTGTSEKPEFDPDELPTKALRLPGVVKINAEVLCRHIENGLITYKEVEKARGTYWTRPAVKGPQTIVFKVG